MLTNFATVVHPAGFEPVTYASKGQGAQRADCSRKLFASFFSCTSNHHKDREQVLALVDRDSGTARTMVVDTATAREIMPIVRANVAREAVVMTDESNIYRSVTTHFAAHGMTNHSVGQYVDYECLRFIRTPLRAISRFSSVE